MSVLIIYVNKLNPQRIQYIRDLVRNHKYKIQLFCSEKWDPTTYDVRNESQLEKLTSFGPTAYLIVAPEGKYY